MVDEIIASSRQGNSYIPVLRVPLVQLHCDSDDCQGVRYFAHTGIHAIKRESTTEHFVEFICRHCRKTKKTYAVTVLPDEEGDNGYLFKFGEEPPFGPPTPAKVISLIGGERDYFLKGRRCENQGLGIAAFAYYRRVVENQKGRILAEVHRVAARLGAAEEVLSELVAAQAEVQFSKAIESIKHAIPQILLINGHNPLMLLHSALSEGLHATTDDECLQLATSIRIVLTELVDRMNVALKDEAELTGAVNHLMKAIGKQKARK